MNWHATFLALFVVCVATLTLGFFFLPLIESQIGARRTTAIAAALIIGAALLAGLVWA